MLSKRKLLLKKKDKIDEEIEEIVIDDEEIDLVFKLDKKSKKNTKNGLKLYDEIRKSKVGKSVQNNQANENPENNVDQVKINPSNSSKLNETIIFLDSDDLTEPNNASLISLNCSTPAKKTFSRNSRLEDTDDEILICSNSNSPVKSHLADSSFDPAQFDALISSTFKFTKKINLKFRYKGEYKCVQFNSNDQFKDKLEDISEKLSIDISTMILIFDEKTISFEETPDSLGIGITDIIDVFEKKNNENLIEEDPNLFKVKFRDCESRKRNQDVTLTMNRYDNFAQIFRKYAELKELDLNEIIFEFDGEKMTQDQKPEDLDMESDSLIDVKIKN